MLSHAPWRTHATPARSGDASGGRRLPWRVPAVATARQHWLLSALLAAGVALRVLAVAAYHPALIYVDTLKYLYGAYPGAEPLGYTVVLKVILLAGDLGTVAVIQHLLGLAMAITLYAVLLRRGVARWLAAVAAAPVLLDAYQLQMEQTIMPDAWFEAMIVAGLAVLLWRPAVTMRFAVAAGLILGSSATNKQLGEPLILPAVGYLLAAGGGFGRAIGPSGGVGLALAVAGARVLYGAVARTGHFWLAHGQSHAGRLAAAADCATLKLPAAVRPLCPAPAEQAQGPDWLEHSGQSPLYATVVPAGTRGRLISELDSAVESQQPGRVAVSIAEDSLRLFGLTRTPALWVTPISRWQFQASYPTYPPWISICPAGHLSAQDCLAEQHALQKRVAPVSDMLLRPGGTIVVGVQRQAFGMFHAATLRPSYGGQAQVNRPVAAFLRAYQLDGGYTPGPLLALFALAGLAGSLLAAFPRAPGPRSRGLALACLLFTGTAAVVLLAPDVYEFSWRYQLPAVVTLVPAGVLGIGAAASLRRHQADLGKNLFGRPRVRPEPGGDPGGER